MLFRYLCVDTDICYSPPERDHHKIADQQGR